MLNREIIKTLDEKDFVTSLIMSDKCCQTLLPYIKLTYFDIDYSRTIVSWIIEYYKKFKKAPKQDITSLYRTHCDEIQDEALKELILNYIQELGKTEIQINNEDYLVDKGKDFIDYKALKIYTEELNACLETRSMDKARKIQEEYKKISTAEINEVSLLDINDKDIIQNALDTSEEELFTLPEALSGVFGKIHRNDFIAILAGMKKGKCLGYGTKVLMYDGSIKEVQNLVPNDLLMGPDSKPRKIISTSVGKGKMYRVHTKPDKNGRCEIDFTCNGDHILVLKNDSPKRIKPILKYNKNGKLNGEYLKYGSLNYIKEKECEISVKDYLALSDEHKEHLKLCRTEIEYSENKHKLSPRFLGLWLGDGTSSCADITNPDKEIIDYLYQYASSIGESVQEYKKNSDDCSTFRFSHFIDNVSSGCEGQHKVSNIRKYLSELNLINNKHIPLEYLVDSRENRLQLLAGIIDTDGWADEHNYEITFMNKQLAEDTYRLCRELGFRTTFITNYDKYKDMYKDTDGWKYSWVISITGRLSEIPLLVSRKKKEDSKKFSSLNNTWTFFIDELNEDNYYGIVIDRDHRFVLADTTVTHNTWALQKLALESMKQRLNVTFVSMEMTREETVQRLWKSLFGSESGLIPDGVYETCRFVEDTSEEGKYRCELVDVNVKNKGKSVTELQKRLRMNNGYSGNLRIIAYPAFGASVVDITNRVEELAENGFVTDVLIIDYSDITKPIGGGSELRNQLDMIWKHLRSFAMSFHCAVITASQTNRAGLSSSVVSAETISEDIRKLAHVTSMVSLEQTNAMYKKHIMRMRNIAMRNGSSTGPCVFPQCLALGQFMFGEPILAENLIMDDNEEDKDE